MSFLTDYVSVELLRNVLVVIGLYVLLLYLYDNLKSVVSIAKSILDPYFQPQTGVDLLDKFGNWAVVTGSTDGIGKEYAKELARKGINIVLISRTKEKLVDVSKEIENEFHVKTKWIVADLSKGQEIFQHIEKELAGIPVGILVNNAGKMYDYPEELSKVSEQTLCDIMNINVVASTILSRMVIKQMKANGKGAIVNISSGSELQPLPNMAVYAASKIYIKSFTLALQHELAPYNITVQLITPLFVVTKMNEFSSTVMKGGFLIPDVKSYARWAVFTLGRTNETTGYWVHGLQYAVMKIVPSWFRTLCGLKITSDMRKDYLSTTSKTE